MKRILLVITAITLLAGGLRAQSDTSLWKKGGVISANMSQSSFTNWAAGGENNVNLTALFSAYANRKTLQSNWENNIDLGYGLQRTGNDPTKKSEDRIELNSKYGRKINDKLNYSALLNFRSQFVEGFNYTDSSTDYVSNFLAPSFTTLSIGLDYRPNDYWSIYYSPITSKFTTVFDDTLSKQASYGVDSGKKFRYEFGSLLVLKYQRKFANNLLFKSKMDLFMNYENVQAIDVNWENILSYQFSKYFAFSLTTNLLYDQDILIAKEVETSPGVKIVEKKPRTQFKQVLSVGVTYKF
jgi:Protein of unknown function (DUF3078)